MAALDQIRTIVWLMLENRSFDHILGHLSLPQYGNRADVDGLKEPLRQYRNRHAGRRYHPFALRDGQLSTDLPHERDEIADQMHWSDGSGTFRMDGFVRSYFEFSPLNRQLTPDPLGFLTPEDLPMTSFLAENFGVCDRWFSSLPAGTQPNRLMAWTGTSKIDSNGLFPPRDELFLQWMTHNKVRWRVYHPGISFFLLLKEPEALGTDHFRSLDRFAADAYGEKDKDWPEVVIVEPVYGDVARITGQIPDDEHAPAPVLPGELLIRRVYEALTANEHTWEGTLLVVSYDEHGGFFDHVSPPLVSHAPPAGAKYTEPFRSLGPRVPGLIVSPLVSAGHVCHATLDHTSMLQLLAEKFTPGVPYCDAVEERRRAGVASVSAALNRSTPRQRILTAPGFDGTREWRLGGNPSPVTPLEHRFEEMVKVMTDEQPKGMAKHYPLAVDWVNRQDRRPYDG